MPKRLAAAAPDPIVAHGSTTPKHRAAASSPDGESAAAVILRLLDELRAGASICPSEAARALDAVEWRDRMGEVRQAAVVLAERGLVEIIQRGEPVAPPFRGPIRLRPGRAFRALPRAGDGSLVRYAEGYRQGLRDRDRR